LYQATKKLGPEDLKLPLTDIYISFLCFSFWSIYVFGPNPSQFFLEALRKKTAAIIHPKEQVSVPYDSRIGKNRT